MSSEPGRDGQARPLSSRAGPAAFVYGSASAVATDDVLRHLKRGKRPRAVAAHFLGCRFRDGTRSAFRALGRKLRRRADRLHLRELAVQGVPDVGNAELAHLAPLLDAASSRLRSLALTGGAFDARALAAALGPCLRRRDAALEVLILGDNPDLGDAGLEAVAAALDAGGGGGRLRVLALEACGAGPRGATAIAGLLCRAGGAALRVLELSDNAVGDAGAAALADGLRHGGGRRLARLGLNGAGVGDAGARALGDALRVDRSLRDLSLRRNAGLTERGATRLLGAVYDARSVRAVVGSNHALRNLRLRGCGGVSSDTLALLEELCADGRTRRRTEDVIRRKVAQHVASAGSPAAFEEFGPKLMPHVLACVGGPCGDATALFRTLRCRPPLYARPDPGPARGPRRDGEREAPSGRAFLDQLRRAAKRARTCHAVFAAAVPRRSPVVRGSDRRGRNRHEPSTPASNNSRHYLLSRKVDTAFANQRCVCLLFIILQSGHFTIV